LITFRRLFGKVESSQEVIQEIEAGMVKGA
jgi:hypothetical protein